jgi:hypothetical protein
MLTVVAIVFAPLGLIGAQIEFISRATRPIMGWPAGDD